MPPLNPGFTDAQAVISAIVTSAVVSRYPAREGLQKLSVVGIEPGAEVGGSRRSCVDGLMCPPPTRLLSELPVTFAG